MPSRRRNARGTERDDLADSGVGPIKRGAAGSIQFQNVTTKSGTTVTGTGFSTSAKVERAFASSVSLTINTANTAGGGGVTINNPAGNTFTTAIGNANTISTSNTFTQAPATWTLSASVTTGTVTITSWTVSREDVRG